MASREMLEDVVERLIEQLKVATASLKSMSEDFQQAREKLETLEKEHKRVIHQVGELKEKESKLIRERDEARESAKKSLEKVSQMESKQLARNNQSVKSTTVKPEKFSGSGNDRDLQAFSDQFEVRAKVNNWNEEEKANQLILSQLSSEDKNSYERMVRAVREKIGKRQVPEAAKATLKARRRKVRETLLDVRIDIKRLWREAYPSLSPASLEQACNDHFTDALGATLAKDVIRSKPSTLDKALSEGLELEALELRAIRMRERVVNEVSTHRGKANQMQNASLPGWAPELSTMIASATAKAAAEAVVNAIPLAGVQGNRPPQFRRAGWGRGCWLYGSTYHFQRNCPQGNFRRAGDR